MTAQELASDLGLAIVGHGGPSPRETSDGGKLEQKET